MAKYKNRSEFLQKQHDEKKIKIEYDFIMECKGIDMTQKVVYNCMCNDVYMNGCVTWKQMTYADKLGLSRQQVSNIFKLFESVGILVPHKDNKPGSKKNKYELTTNYKALIKTHNGFKKAVNQDVLSCKPQFTQPVNQDVQTCKPAFTYKTNKTCIKHVLKKDEDVLASSLSEPKKPEVTDEALNELYNEL